MPDRAARAARWHARAWTGRASSISKAGPGVPGRAYSVLYFSWACPGVPLCLGLSKLGTPRHAQGPPRSITGCYQPPKQNISPQSGLAEPNQGEPNRTVPNIGRTEQRSCSFPGEHEPRRTVAPYVRFVWMFGSPGYEPNRTDVSNVRVRFVFGSFGSV